MDHAYQQRSIDLNSQAIAQTVFIKSEPLFDHHPPETTKKRKSRSTAAETPRNFACSYCEKAYTQHVNLIFHIRTHTGERPHICPVCSKAFSQPGNLKTHQNIHLAVRPYACSVCTQRFTQMGNLKTHISRVHGNPYAALECGFCSENFSADKELLKHLKMYHKEDSLAFSSGGEDEAPRHVVGKRKKEKVRFKIALPFN